MYYTLNRRQRQIRLAWVWGCLSLAGWALVGQLWGGVPGAGVGEAVFPPVPEVPGRLRRGGRRRRRWGERPGSAGWRSGWAYWRQEGFLMGVRSLGLWGLWKAGGEQGWVGWVGLPLGVWVLGGLGRVWPELRGCPVFRGLVWGGPWGVWGVLVGWMVLAGEEARWEGEGGGGRSLAGVGGVGGGGGLPWGGRRAGAGECVEHGGRGLRLRRPRREGVVLVPVELDRLLPEDHRARQVWAAVERLDLTEFYGEIKAEEGEPGAAATDPALLVALWVYATAEGEDSARKVARLCVEHLGYIWLCGGVSVNYHTLGDFRVAQGEKLKGLVKQGVGELDGAGEVGWEAAAQDGMRVRASAGAGSFRREGTLEKHLAEARARLVALAEGGGEGVTARQRGARLRGARERVERLEAALRELPEVRAAKPAEEREEARVSETDPEARVMRMADGGYRPAYNWQWVVDTKRRVITEVKVVKVGSDGGQMGPMLEQEEADYGRLPKQWLVDGNFVNLPVIEKAESEKKVEVLAPVPKPKVEGRDRYVPLPKDGPGVGAWRERMGTEAGKELYKQRAASVECVNAQARDRYGVYQVRVRGPEKVESVGWWVALTHDLLLGIGKE